VALLCSVLMVQGTLATARSYGYESGVGAETSRALLSADCVRTDQRCVTAQKGSTATVDYETSCGKLDVVNVDVVRSYPPPRCGWPSWVFSQGAGKLGLATDCLDPGFYLLRVGFRGGASLLVDLYVYDREGRVTPSTACLYAQAGSLGGWPGHICSCV